MNFSLIFFQFLENSNQFDFEFFLSLFIFISSVKQKTVKVEKEIKYPMLGVLCRNFYFSFRFKELRHCGFSKL